MAGNLAAMNNYLQNTIGIAELATRTALNDQGLDAFVSLDTFTDADIKSICENVRKPGGTIPNPAIAAAATAEAAAAVQPREVPNRGRQLGFVFEKRLRQLRFYKFHMTRIQREFTPNQASLARLNRVWALYESEREEIDVADPPQLLKVEDVRRVLESIDNVLNVKRGVCGAPLAYVTRSKVTLPGALDTDTADEADPGFGLPSHPEELVRRTRHVGSNNTAATSNIKVNLLIWASCEEKVIFLAGRFEVWI